MKKILTPAKPLNPWRYASALGINMPQDYLNAAEHCFRRTQRSQRVRAIVQHYGGVYRMVGGIPVYTRGR